MAGDLGILGKAVLEHGAAGLCIIGRFACRLRCGQVQSTVGA
jgi:hypothetical protein